MAETGVALRRLRLPDDRGMLAAWLAEPHVRAWWGDPATEIRLIEEGEATGASEGWIGLADGRPVAYLQSWPPCPEAEAEWGVPMPADALGVDMFVGPSDATGRGIGPRLLDAFAVALFARGVRRLVIDPDAANRRARRAYEKAGFRAIAEVGAGGDTVLMERLSPAMEETIG